MTRLQWQRSVDIGAMLRCAGVRMSPRKRRLFACACCRHVEFMIDWAFEGRRGDYRDALETSERFADGLATEDELRKDFFGADDSWFCNLDVESVEGEKSPGDPFRDVASADLEKIDDLWRCLLVFIRGYGLDRTADGWSLRVGPKRRHPADERAERRAQAALLRDIVGPLIPPNFDPAWRTDNVVEIARGLYEDRTFERLPILGDALEEAGCDDAEILNHCRTPGTHVRGCWVVDSILGRI